MCQLAILTYFCAILNTVAILFKLYFGTAHVLILLSNAYPFIGGISLIFFCFSTTEIPGVKDAPASSKSRRLQKACR